MAEFYTGKMKQQNSQIPKKLVYLLILALIIALALLWPKESQQPLYLLCLENDTREGQAIFQYDAARDTWTRLFDGRSFAQLFSTPDDNGLILTENHDQGKQTILWQVGKEELFLFDESKATAGEMSPDGRILVLDTVLANRTELLLMNSCQETGCQTTTIPGHPVWSPNGMRTLIESDQGVWTNPASPLRVESRPGIYLGNEIGVAESVLLQKSQRNPSWLTNTTFIYHDIDFDILLGLSGVLYKASIDGSSRKVADVENFWDLDSDLNLYNYFLISEVFPNKLNENEIFVDLTAFGIEGEDSHRIVTLNLENQESKTLLESSSYILAEVSADGHWFSGLTRASDRTNQLAVISFQDKDVQIFELGTIFLTDQDWSINGETLIVLSKEAFFLIKPSANQIRVHHYPENINFCNSAVWGP